VDTIVVFDVETPNFNNDRICAIGISVIENGEIVKSRYSLVNPECEFDYRNIQIHGITPSDVNDAPTFPEVWGLSEPCSGQILLRRTMRLLTCAFCEKRCRHTR
jgi:DNA polymerase-3 subunit epsilon